MSAIDEARKLDWWCELCAQATDIPGSVVHPIGKHKPGLSWPRRSAPVVREVKRAKGPAPEPPATGSFAARLRQVVRSNAAVIVPKLRLSGDTAETVRALHALNSAGLLEPNVYADGWYSEGGVVVFHADKAQKTLPCPRCGRQTAVWGWRLPSVCTGCRAEYHRDHAPNRDGAAGPCVRCQLPCCRYGPLGRPLCSGCEGMSAK